MSADEPQPVVLCFDVGATHLRLGLVTEHAQLLATSITGSAPIFAAPEPMAAFRNCLTSYLAETLQGRRLLAISGGFPSTISADRTRIISTPNIAQLQNVSISAELACFGIPVIVDRDVNNLLRFDLRDHRLPSDGIVIGCYLGSGFGSAIAINGQPIAGSHGVAGELGHLPVHGNDRRCGCGNLGCVETLASGLALSKFLAANLPDIALENVFSRCPDEPFVTRFVEYAAEAIAAEINILDPTAVVLGGGVIQMRDFPRTRLENLIRRHSRKPLPAEELNFSYSRPSQHNGVIGAGLAAWERLVPLNRTPLKEQP